METCETATRTMPEPSAEDGARPLHVAVHHQDIGVGGAERVTLSSLGHREMP